MKREQTGEETFDLKRQILGWLESIVLAVAVVALLITFVARPIMVDGHSMENTLYDRERIIVTPLAKQYSYGDIVVVRRKGDTMLVKRVIATEGQTVDFDYANHTIYVDGAALDEEYIKEEMVEPIYRTISFPTTVPEGHVFVLGDNRNDSKDSRHPEIGMIDTRNVLGKAVFCIWPFERFGKIEE
jgi:signal peptidase I